MPSVGDPGGSGSAAPQDPGWPPPELDTARANRAFLGRAVRYLAAEAGVRQFLDIGCEIPAAGSTHEVAQAAAPACRVVYADHDPIVLAHAQALMSGGRAGARPRSSRRTCTSRAGFSPTRGCAGPWT